MEPAREWVAANDFIYWINGINDRTYQNRTAHSAPLISVDLADVTVDDDTPWAPYLDSAPAHVLVYLDKLEFTISPWWNVTEPDGRVDPAIVAARKPFKISLYSGLANTRAIQVQTGTGQAEVMSTIEGTPPSVDWHWRIPAANVASFEASLGLPAGLALTTVQLEEGEAADYWLSLNVHRVSGAASGLRAEWSTFVDDGKGDGPRNLILEARADHPALDPVDRFTNPYPVTHAVAGTSVNTDVGSGATAFSSSFVVPPAGSAATVLASRELGRSERAPLLAQRDLRPRRARQQRVQPQGLDRPRNGVLVRRRSVGRVRGRHSRPCVGHCGQHGPGHQSLGQRRWWLKPRWSRPSSAGSESDESSR